MKTIRTAAVLIGAFALTHGALADKGATDELMFDTDTQTYLTDADGDRFPDLTEKIAGTDSLDASDYPGSEIKADEDDTRSAGFASILCRWGFRTVGNLCIDFNVQNATRYDRAAQRCRSRYARVATYEDLAYLFLVSTVDATYNPNGRWLGNMTGNNQVLRGNANVTFNNDPDIFNFEDTANKADNRAYWCAHDRG